MVTLSLRHRILCAIGALTLTQACSDNEAAPTSSMGGAGGTAAGASGAGAGGTLAGSGGTAAGSGGTLAGSGGTTAGAGGAHSGSGGAPAGAGGAPVAGSGGAPVAGSGGSGVCGPNSYGSHDEKICYGLDGQSTTKLTNNLYEGVWGPSCTGLVRQSGDACPGAEVFASGCNLQNCSVHSVIPNAGPTAEGDLCCYDSSVCMGASGCGRPLRVEGLARKALVAGRRDWG